MPDIQEVLREFGRRNGFPADWYTWADTDEAGQPIPLAQRASLENTIPRKDGAYAPSQEQFDALAHELDAKAKRADVFAERDRRLHEGLRITVSGYGEIPVQGRQSDMIAYIAIKDAARDLAAQGVTDPVITFRDAKNTIHHLTPAQAVELISRGQAAAQAIYAASWAMLDDPAGIPDDYAADARWSKRKRG